MRNGLNEYGLEIFVFVKRNFVDFIKNLLLNEVLSFLVLSIHMVLSANETITNHIRIDLPSLFMGCCSLAACCDANLVFELNPMLILMEPAGARLLVSTLGLGLN